MSSLVLCKHWLVQGLPHKFYKTAAVSFKIVQRGMTGRKAEETFSSFTKRIPMQPSDIIDSSDFQIFLIWPQQFEGWLVPSLP